MRARCSRLLLAVTTAGLAVGLAGCSTGDAPSAGRAQELRNDSTEQLSAAQQSILVPVAGQLDQLTRARQAAVRSGSAAQTADAERQIAAYSALERSIEAAGSPAAVRDLVQRSGLDLDRSADPAADVPAAG